MINETDAMLEVVCVFAPNTEAIGCEVAVVRLSNEEVVNRMRANRTMNSATITFQKVFTDQYRLDVFEIENNGSIIQALTELFQLSAQQPTSETLSCILPTSLEVLQIITFSSFISKFL